MHIEEISTLQGNDWNAEWMRLQRVRRSRDDSQYWNKRSKNFDTQASVNPYAQRFIELACLRPDETVFDMGCGTGTLAVPLAKRGHRVIGADFSEGMLEQLTLRATIANTQVQTLHLAWNDNWETRGLAKDDVDVAFASRSIATDDLKAALDKLTWIAKRRCCITLPCGSSPRMDPRILKACGVENLHGRDHQYAWNILVNEGLEPTVDYIRSTRIDTFMSYDDARADFGRMLEDVIDQADTQTLTAAKLKLDRWLEQNIIPNSHAGEPDAKGIAQGALTLRNPRIVTWAFIAWEV